MQNYFVFIDFAVIIFAEILGQIRKKEDRLAIKQDGLYLTGVFCSYNNTKLSIN